jgi:hypothetical protein
MDEDLSVGAPEGAKMGTEDLLEPQKSIPLYGGTEGFEDDFKRLTIAGKLS